MNSPIRVSKGNFVSALFLSLGRDVRDLLANPLAFVGGILGLVVTAAGLFFGTAAMARAAANAQDDATEDDFEIDFTPGTIARLGVRPDEQEMPQKIIVQETRAPDPVEEEPVKEAVTTDEKAQPADEPKQDKPKDQTKDKSKYMDNKDRKLPTSDTPSSSNTPYDRDLPTVKQNTGDPFGDPDGWDDLTREGDPWSTAVMGALNHMPIGAYSGRIPPGDFKFQLSICKDGKIKQVLKKGGSLPSDVQAAVLLALEQLEIPKPPKKVADSMPGNCAKIKYTFVWTASRVK